MSKKPSFSTDLHAALFKFAMRFPGAEEGIACEGTAIEQPSVHVGKKSFLFVGKTRIMLKLSESVSECVLLAKEQPRVYKSGAGGWTTITIIPGDLPPVDLLKRWVKESYRLVAPVSAPKKVAAKGSVTRRKR
jgi:hypothetical protein